MTRKSLYGKTQAEAREILLTAQQDVRQGKPAPGTSKRLDAYLDYWLEEVILPNKRPGTYSDYQWYVVRFLKPGLGSYALDELSVSVLQTWLNYIYRQGEFLYNGKLYKVSADRIQKIRKVLSTALSRAEREELVARNVAQKVDLPQYQAKERIPWTDDEARKFLAATVGHELYPAFLVLLTCGLRRGELLGLRWGDVDFEHGFLHIRNQLQRDSKGFRHGPPKSDAGIRDIPLTAPVRKILLDVGLKRGALKELPSAESLVFVNDLGMPRDPNAFRVTFKRLAKRCGLREITVHDVRHTTATLFKDLGVPVKDAQKVLGHANITTTQQIYEHSTSKARKVALEKVEGVLLPAPPSVTSEAESTTGVGCRQLSSNQWIIGATPMAMLASSTSVNNWYTRQDSNLRPLAPQFKVPTLRERLTGVDAAVSACRKALIIGVVVVKTVVKT
jgi:integrase